MFETSAEATQSSEKKNVMNECLWTLLANCETPFGEPKAKQTTLDYLISRLAPCSAVLTLSPHEPAIKSSTHHRALLITLCSRNAYIVSLCYVSRNVVHGVSLCYVSRNVVHSVFISSNQSGALMASSASIP